MRRIRYCVAASLDGFIAGPKGEYDWLFMDPDIDFADMMSQFDTMLVGRKTFDLVAQQGGPGMDSMNVLVFSRKLKQKDHPKVIIISKDVKKTLAKLRKQKGKDIWLFGGGELFRSLLDLGLVDSVEVAIIPVLLGDGIPLMPAPYTQAKLKFIKHRLYAKTGTLALEYAVR